MGCSGDPGIKRKRQFQRSVINLMVAQTHVRYMALALLFTFCQVIGTMCALPDLSEARDMAVLTEDHMACLMDGTIMCPPSLTSSPGRQLKQSLISCLDHVPVLQSRVLSGTTVSVAPTPWARSSALSIVPISIESSLVLRI